MTGENSLKGFEIVYEAPSLRHFTARFAPLPEREALVPACESASSMREEVLV